MDYDEILNLIGGGYGRTPNAGLAPPASFGYINTTPLTKNLTKAKEMLDQLGYKDINNDGYREKPDGSKFQPDLKSRTDAPYPQAAQLVKTYLNSIGIDVQIKLIDVSSWSSIFIKAHDYDMGLARTSVWGTLDWAGYATCYFDKRNVCWSGNSNKDFEDLVDAYMAAPTIQKQLEYGAKIQQYYADNMPAFAVYWGTVIQPVSAKYTGYGLPPYLGIMSYVTFFNLQKVK
jgi:peptide/nickel transport system substrate-binding protein